MTYRQYKLVGKYPFGSKKQEEVEREREGGGGGGGGEKD